MRLAFRQTHLYRFVNMEFVITLDAKFQWRCKHTICLVVSIISLFGQKGDVNLQVLLDGH